MTRCIILFWDGCFPGDLDARRLFCIPVGNIVWVFVFGGSFPYLLNFFPFCR